MLAGKFKLENKNRERIALWAAWASAILGLAVAVASFGFEDINTGVQVQATDVAYQAGQIDRLAIEVARLKVEQQQVEGALNRSPQDVQLRVLAQQIEAMKQKLARIEQAIVSSPEKALELPMLRNDIDNMKEANAQQLAAIQASVNQVYDLNKWLLGAMALAIVGLAMTRLLTHKSE